VRLNGARLEAHGGRTGSGAAPTPHAARRTPEGDFGSGSAPHLNEGTVGLGRLSRVRWHRPTRVLGVWRARGASIVFFGLHRISGRHLERGGDRHSNLFVCLLFVCLFVSSNSKPQVSAYGFMASAIVLSAPAARCAGATPLGSAMRARLCPPSGPPAPALQTRSKRPAAAARRVSRPFAPARRRS
jgi:hypothetical protein